jgi:hypothetical protein
MNEPVVLKRPADLPRRPLRASAPLTLEEEKKLRGELQGLGLL